MQHNLPSQDGTIAQFLHLSRIHLGLMQVPVAAMPPRRIAGNIRHVLRSLIVAGSLGALFGSPAFASSASREPEPPDRSHSTHGVRTATGDQATLSKTHSLNSKYH